MDSFGPQVDFALESAPVEPHEPPSLIFFKDDNRRNWTIPLSDLENSSAAAGPESGGPRGRRRRRVVAQSCLVESCTTPFLLFESRAPVPTYARAHKFFKPGPHRRFKYLPTLARDSIRQGLVAASR